MEYHSEHAMNLANSLFFYRLYLKVSSSDPEEECELWKSFCNEWAAECLSDEIEESGSYFKRTETRISCLSWKTTQSPLRYLRRKCFHKLYGDMERRLSEETINSNNMITIEYNNDSIRYEFERSCSEESL